MEDKDKELKNLPKEILKQIEKRKDILINDKLVKK